MYRFSRCANTTCCRSSGRRPWATSRPTGSKIPRIVHHYARGLQNQERLVQQVAECLEDALKPKGVGVILHARHLCMEMRGVQIAGTVTTTSALRGVFVDDARCRREFLDFDAKPGA